VTVTATPTRPAPARRRPGAFSAADLVPVAGSIAIAVAITSPAFFLTALDGSVGYAVVAYGVFLAAYGLWSTRVLGRVAATDRIATVVVASFGLLALVPLGILLWFTVDRGLPGLRSNFFTETLGEVGPLDPASKGGALHAIVGTLQQVALAAVISTPLGILTAVYLSEFHGRAERLVRFFVDSMSGTPSIVAGMFVYTMWVLQLDQGYSGLAAAMALSVLMLPTVARTAEEMLRLVPGGLRESALALGAPQWRTILRIVVPTARGGLITAVLLGVARVVGETAPLIMTAFGGDQLHTNPLSGAQSALPLFAYQRIRNALESEVQRGWAAALVLVLLVLILFTLTRVVAARGRKVA
jgi:phosphate transport system permease protein